MFAVNAVFVVESSPVILVSHLWLSLIKCISEVFLPYLHPREECVLLIVDIMLGYKALVLLSYYKL